MEVHLFCPPGARYRSGSKLWEPRASSHQPAAAARVEKLRARGLRFLDLRVARALESQFPWHACHCVVLMCGSCVLLVHLGVA